MNKHPFSQIYRFLCCYCNYLVETEGPWPYWREGKVRQYYESLYEACSRPIQGLMARVYCPYCDKKKEYRIVEYEKPLPNLSGIWWTDIPRKTKLSCHRCKKPVYFILPPGEVKCPRCKKGTFDLYEPMAREESECLPVAPPNLPLRVRQNGKTIRIPKPTIVIDSQKHMGYKFERFSNWFAGRFEGG
jgi:Zn finger protein HypA/HybF involved in hydrogenase expression